MSAQASLCWPAEEFAPLHLCSPWRFPEVAMASSSSSWLWAGGLGGFPYLPGRSRGRKPHKGAGMEFSGVWITQHSPTKVICWINAHCRTGCMRRGRKRRKKSGLRSSLDIFGSSPGSVPLGRASLLYYKQKYMQLLQLVISNLLNSQRCRGDIKFFTFSGNIMNWLEVGHDLCSPAASVPDTGSGYRFLRVFQYAEAFLYPSSSTQETKWVIFLPCA